MVETTNRFAAIDGGDNAGANGGKTKKERKRLQRSITDLRRDLKVVETRLRSEPPRQRGGAPADPAALVNGLLDMRDNNEGIDAWAQRIASTLPLHTRKAVSDVLREEHGKEAAKEVSSSHDHGGVVALRVIRFRIATLTGGTGTGIG